MTMYEYITIITVYDPRGKTELVRYDRWSSNHEYSKADETRIKDFVICGVYDQGDNFSKYAAHHGCNIEVHECKEVAKISLSSKDMK